MISYLTEFVIRCKKAGIKPNEKHIDAYLSSIGKTKYTEPFIRICFWYWDELTE